MSLKLFLLYPVGSHDGGGGIGTASGDNGGLLGLTGYRRRLGDGKREPTKLPSAGNADPPGQLRLVA